jgi:hypothetical protein
MITFSQLREATTGRDGVKCSAEKSQFGGYRALCKRGSKTIYNSQVSYKDAATAKKHAEVYADAYYSQGEKAADRAVRAFQQKNASKQYVKEGVELDEGYKTPEEAKAFEDGKKAARAGKKYDDNPHKDDKLKLAWSKGHNKARAGKMRESVELDESLSAMIRKKHDKTKKDQADAKKNIALKQRLKKSGIEVKEEDLDENKKSHPQGSAKFYRGAMDKYKAKTPKKSPWDMYMDYKRTKKEGVTERRKDSAKDVYWQSYSLAIRHALAQAKKKGYEIDQDDIDREISFGSGKPGRGKTVRHTLPLKKNGKEQRKALHIQVYNRDTDKNPFELNSYIS